MQVSIQDMKQAKLQFTSHSADETERFGELLGHCLCKGDVVAIQGELGAGKTCFVRGMSRGLQGVDGSEVHSPSFTLVNCYDGRPKLYHLDLYRVDGLEDAASLGYDELLAAEAVVAVEWADKLPEQFTSANIRVILDYNEGSGRTVIITTDPKRLEEIEKGFKA